MRVPISFHAKRNGNQNMVEIIFLVCYSKCNERHLREQMPFAEPHSKGGVSQAGVYLSVRGAHPAVDRMGIIFLSFYPYRKYE